MTQDPNHNAKSLNTLWDLRLVDDALYESAKGRLPDSPDFETPERVPAVGGPAAALVWLIDSGLLARSDSRPLDDSASRSLRKTLPRRLGHCNASIFWKPSIPTFITPLVQKRTKTFEEITRSAIGR